MFQKRIKSFAKSLIRVYHQVRAEATPVQFTDNDGDNLVFATGFDKSGTTWLMDILNLHPEITCRGSGQIFNFYQDIHFLGDPGGYGVFIKNTVESRWFGMGGKVWLDENLVAANFRNLIAASFERYNIKKSRFVGDKSTVQDVALIRKMFPKAKIICMVRDGRDVAVSFAYHFKRGGTSNKFNEDGTFQENYLKQVMEAWVSYSKHIRENKFDKGLKIIKYEELLESPSDVISEVYKFMGVNTPDDVLRQVVEETAFENQSGRKPGEEDPKSYFRKGIVGDWKNHFGEKEKEIIRQIGGEELMMWGYTKDLNW